MFHALHSKQTLILPVAKKQDLYANPFKYDLNEVVRKENKVIFRIFQIFLFTYLKILVDR